MNWLAKINLRTVFLRLGPFKTALALASLIALCLYCGYRFGNFYHSYQQKSLDEQQERLALLYQELDTTHNKINTLEVELEIERMANQQSAILLSKAEAEHYKVKKELAFYEKVMAPEKQAEGVVIDNLIITPTTSTNHYRFQVVLVQQNKQKRYAKGYVQLTFSGSLNNQPNHFMLSKISTVTRTEMSFNFQYFQMIEGEFTLPENFTPEQILVTAILPKGKWQKYNRLEQNYPWQNDYLKLD